VTDGLSPDSQPPERCTEGTPGGPSIQNGRWGEPREREPRRDDHDPLVDGVDQLGAEVRKLLPMSTIGSLVSPVIVGRDDLVALAERRIEEVSRGRGQCLLVSGEAGIGKTRLLDAIVALAAGRGFRVAKGELAPQDRDVLAASFLDLGRAMRRDAAFGSIGREMLEIAQTRLNADLPHRRNLVMEIVDLIGASDRPTLLAFEDLQWADDLSLETLTEVARQTRSKPVLLVGAYRSNEALHGSVLREWRSRLVTQRIAEEIRLDRLSRDETALMTTLILGTGLPAPRDVVDAVYARTDGVPLHVEELCSVLGRERLADSRAVLEAAVPETLEDATLARIARLSADAQQVARAGAVIGRSFVPTVLAGIMNLPVHMLDDPIQELVDHDVLDPVHGDGHYDFRHQLLRDALYRSLSAGDRRRLHARAAEFGGMLEGASETHASVHFERAGMTDEAFRTALSAAKQAMKLSSHREALDLARRAVENMPTSLTEGEKAGVLLLYSDAAGNADRNVLSADLATRARQVALRAGEPLLAIEALNNLALVARREGAPIPDRRDGARALLNEVEAAPQSPLRALFQVVGLHLLALAELDDGRLVQCREFIEEAREIGVRLDVASEAAWRDGFLAQLDVIEGRVADGLARIRSLGHAVRAKGREDLGVSCYREAAQSALRAIDFRQASTDVTEGLRYAESVEQSYCGHILASCEALLSWGDGRWDDARQQAGHAVSDPGSALARAIAQLALGYVEAGRGRRSEAEAHLRPSLEFARRAGQFEVLLPAQWGLAEAALHTGDPDHASALAEDALRLTRERGDLTLIAPFAVTGVRAHQMAGRPDAGSRFLDQVVRSVMPHESLIQPALDHARGLAKLADGSVTAARDAFDAAIRGWDERGRAWEALWARLDLASALVRSSRFGEAMVLVHEVTAAADRLGSAPLLARAAQLTRTTRGRGEELDAWHPLTMRELEVARKIAEGLTNAELAKELGISPKTASAHVEHILAKLDVNRRAEIAAWVATLQAAAVPPRNDAPLAS
jgi:DNA-binding CsgD family transcriptional regulator